MNEIVMSTNNKNGTVTNLANEMTKNGGGTMIKFHLEKKPHKYRLNLMYIKQF